MQRVIMTSEIHRATMGGAALDFDGSCAIAPSSMRAADIVVAPRTVCIDDTANRVGDRAAIA